ncbi:hypothetical protein Fleli_3810 [Bernardetia litoralis DSM 6794]|uniref:Uncharacterized protein n=1 Tax=Bernardetia litoralis (strain ATCC 23117 / DSM 6794 / NBRC 15988 / NCIMB 1366 / Fx l1 / Sio-4) TaxID=880071 RepID=I4AQ81_BERLS|nr:hypothetical protein Fleli_3810 [Bernardetia litoralis DSM 6794]
MKDKLKIKKTTLSKSKTSVNDKSLKVFFYSFIGSCILIFVIMIVHIMKGMQVFIPSVYIILPLLLYIVFGVLWFAILIQKGYKKGDSIVVIVILYSFIITAQTLFF